MASQRYYGPGTEQGTELEEDRRERAQTGSNSDSDNADIESREPKCNGAGGLASGLRWLEALLLFVAFVLMVFASSTPVTKNFYIFSLRISTSAAIDTVSDAFTFGVWGYCSSGVSNSLGVGKLNINSKVAGDSCGDRKLGWTFKNIPGLSDDTQDAISEALTGMFILHVVAAVFLFPALCTAVIGAAKPDMLVKHAQTPDTSEVCDEDREQESGEERVNVDGEEREETGEYQEPDKQDVSAGRRKLRGIVALAILVSLIFILIVFIVDVVGLLITKQTVHDKSKGDAKLEFGPAFWLVIFSSGLVLLAFLAAFVDLNVLKPSNDSAVEGEEYDEEDIIVTDNTSPQHNAPSPYSGDISDANTGSNYSNYSTKDDDDEMQSISLSDTEDEKRRRNEL